MIDFDAIHDSIPFVGAFFVGHDDIAIIVCTMQFLQMGINLFLRMLHATADSAM